MAGVAARDGVELGNKLGRALIEVAPKGNWVITKGEEGTDIARLKAQGGMEIIKGALDKGDIKIVSDQYMRAWSPDLARKQMEQALTANNNDIAAALVYADSMSYGTIQALKAQDRNGKVFVSGEDGEPEMLKLILKGDAYVTAWTKFDEMGERAAELLYAALAKKPVETTTTVDNGSGQPNSLVQDQHRKRHQGWQGAQLHHCRPVRQGEPLVGDREGTWPVSASSATGRSTSPLS